MSDASSNVKNWPLILAIIGLISSVVLQFFNQRFERDLEDKKMEISLITNAINTADPIKTKQNLQFLLKGGLISNSRQKILENLSDSIYSDSNANDLTKSDTCQYYDIQVLTGLTILERPRGNFLVSFESIEGTKSLKFFGFTDQTGKIQMAFPQAVSGRSFKIKIEKSGYKTISYNYIFPKDIRTETTNAKIINMTLN